MYENVFDLYHIIFMSVGGAYVGGAYVWVGHMCGEIKKIDIYCIEENKFILQP
jgi:hypothetical protein